MNKELDIKYDFMKRKKFFVILSLFIIIIQLISMGFRGFNLGLDFKAGINLELKIENNDIIDIKQINDILEKDFTKSQIKRVGIDSDNIFSIRIAEDQDNINFKEDVPKNIIKLLNEKFEIKELSRYFVGSSFSSKLIRQTIILFSFSLVLIFVYLSFRFEFKYGISSILTLLHDVFFMIGFISLLKIEVSTSVVAALLTLIGYSLNDTIVIFDRIRENEKNQRSKFDNDIEKAINIAINQSLTRTLITSLTTLFTTVIIAIFTEGQIRDFAVVLTIGIIIGTFSSIFIASPLLILIHKNKFIRVEKEIDDKGNENIVVMGKKTIDKNEEELNKIVKRELLENQQKLQKKSKKKKDPKKKK